jgi:glucosamine-6-phosphate deaminase
MIDGSASTAHIDALAIRFFPSRAALGAAAAADAADLIGIAAEEKGEANLLLASGNSQLEFLAALRTMPDVGWRSVNIFHMDEYLGLAPGHPARFANFLRRELLDFVRPKAFHPVLEGESDPEQAARDYTKLLRLFPIDVCVLGIGENGHLAFNDPPADFHDPVRLKTVELAEDSRRQQVGEGHFATLAEVPRQALTLTVPALLDAKRILAVVPEARKAAAVEGALRGPIDPACPASILRACPHAVLYLDADSGAQVRGR